MHLVAIAKAAGILINWDDFSDLSQHIPSITKVYPNGKADINHFHAAGGMPYVIRTLLDHGLLHRDVQTIVGSDMYEYTKEAKLINNTLSFVDGPDQSHDLDVIRPADEIMTKKEALLQLMAI